MKVEHEMDPWKNCQTPQPQTEANIANNQISPKFEDNFEPVPGTYVKLPDHEKYLAALGKSVPPF